MYIALFDFSCFSGIPSSSSFWDISRVLLFPCCRVLSRRLFDFLVLNCFKILNTDEDTKKVLTTLVVIFQIFVPKFIWCTQTNFKRNLFYFMCPNLEIRTAFALCVYPNIIKLTFVCSLKLQVLKSTLLINYYHAWKKRFTNNLFRLGNF